MPRQVSTVLMRPGHRSADITPERWRGNAALPPRLGHGQATRHGGTATAAAAAAAAALKLPRTRRPAGALGDCARNKVAVSGLIFGGRGVSKPMQVGRDTHTNATPDDWAQNQYTDQTPTPKRKNVHTSAYAKKGGKRRKRKPLLMHTPAYLLKQPTRHAPARQIQFRSSLCLTTINVGPST